MVLVYRVLKKRDLRRSALTAQKLRSKRVWMDSLSYRDCCHYGEHGGCLTLTVWLQCCRSDSPFLSRMVLVQRVLKKRDLGQAALAVQKLGSKRVRMHAL